MESPNATGKALSILLIIAERSPAPVTVGDLVERLGFNQSTCSFALKSLAEYAFVTALPKRAGYVLGPSAFALARSDSHIRRFVEQSTPVLEDFGRSLNEGFVLSFWQGGRLLIAWRYLAQRDVVVNANSQHLQNVYFTASGRVLLAFQDEKERESFVGRTGLPTWEWPDIQNTQELHQQLNLIREEGCVVIPKKEMVSLATIVRPRDLPVAALGVSIPLHRWSEDLGNKVLTGMQECAARIAELACQPRKIPQVTEEN